MTSTQHNATDANAATWSTNLYEMAQAISGFGIWILDLRTGHWTLSPLARQILGTLPPAPCGRDALSAKLSPLDRLRMETAWSSFLDSNRGFELEYALEEAGETRWILEKAKIECDQTGAPWRVVGVAQDISARRADEAALVRRANFDVLTGLPSRGLLEAHLEKSIATAARRQERLALLLIDLDPPPGNSILKPLGAVRIFIFAGLFGSWLRGIPQGGGAGFGDRLVTDMIVQTHPARAGKMNPYGL